jgi:hypothetical protein
MAESSNVSPIAPTAVPPAQQSTTYERKMAPDMPGGRGPLRFEEGLATDTDLPMEFVNGAHQGYATAPGRPNHNVNVYEKGPDETMRERVHVGSASWVEAPTYLGAFAGGTSAEAERKYIQVDRSGGKYVRRNASQVTD